MCMRGSFNLSQYLRVGFYGVFVTTLVIAFQNCSSAKFGSTDQPKSTSSMQGGTGIDGKTYTSYGQCSTGSVAVKEKVFVNSQGSAYLLRENCQDLPKPLVIDSSRIQFASGDPAVFQMDKKIFDLQTEAASQKVTLSFCHYTGPSVQLETLIWQNTTTALLGRVTENSTLSSGVLNVESNAANQYSSVAGQASQFLLALSSPTSGAITYSIAGNPQNSLPVIECASQAAKPYDDGSANAPSGPAQKPTLLASYAARPSWRVAGVDYAVGPRATPTVNPAQLNMSGVSVNTTSRVVTVSGHAVFLDGVDFSLGGGYDIIVTGNNVTITNSKFVQGANSGMFAVDGRGDGLSISYCIFDGGTSDNVALIGFSGRNIHLEYNWFLNSDRALQMRQASNINSTFSIKYNLFESGTKNGFNYIEIGVSNFTYVQVEFNTSVETTQSTRSHGFDFGRYAGGTIDSILFANNTILAMGTSSMDYPLNGGGSSITNGIARDNYFDLSGAQAAYYPGTMTGWTSTTAVNMSNGQSF